MPGCLRPCARNSPRWRPPSSRDVPEGVDTDESELARLLGLAAHFESEAPPEERIRDVLSPRVPQFLLFDDEHRALDTEYVWEDHPEPRGA